ncbi:MAG: hypothetical protein INR70_31780 [Parafilimonas terrae]|nr:hypothetical protein [Parafilimonas terrae]
MGAVISFFRPASTSQGGWSQQELAEFYRVEAALIRAGLEIGSEQGLSDEAEPWFVFCRPDGDAIMHFARIDGSYVIASDVLDSPMRGGDFRALINQVAQRYPELLPIPQGADGTKLSVHPAALLAALIAAAALSLSPQDAFAADQEHAGDGPVPAGPLGQTLQHRAAGGGDSGDADERDSHRKQFGVIVFSAMVFAADAAAADHGEPATEPNLSFGSPGGNAVAVWEQGSVPVPAGEAIRTASAGMPLTSGASGQTASGTAGSTTAEPSSVAPSQPGSTDVGAIGPGHPTLVHGPAWSGLEPAYQASAQAAEAGTPRTAGPSTSPEARPDAVAAASGSADGAGQAGPSPATNGETASQHQSAAQTIGHSGPETPSSPIDGVTATTQAELTRLAPAWKEDGTGGQEHAARGGSVPEGGVSRAANAVGDPAHSGRSEPDQDRPGADGHGAATSTNAGHQSGASQVEASGADPGSAQASETPGKSGEAPGQLKEAGSATHGAEGHGAATSTNAGHQSGASQTEANGADPGHVQPGAGAQGAPHANTPAAADPGPQTSSGQPADPPGSGASPAMSGGQPSSVSQTSHAGGQSQAQPPAAQVDPAGNLVFSSDGQRGHAAAPSHTPAEAGSHGSVELIGLLDHGSNAHHIDLHS